MSSTQTTPGGEQEPGGLVPPYDGRTTGPETSETTAARTQAVESQLAETDAGRPGATASPADEKPVAEGEVTAEEPDTPLGVGESMTRGAEDVAREDGKEPGRADLGTKDPSQRPVGTSDQRSSTSIDPQDLADPAMPNT